MHYEARRAWDSHDQIYFLARRRDICVDLLSFQEREHRKFTEKVGERRVAGN